VVGVATTREFQMKLLHEKKFLDNSYTTTFIQENLERIVKEMEGGK
jgi:pyruvate carboxylase